MTEINEGQAVISALTETLKKDKVDKGLYPEDLYLVNYLTRAARVFEEKALESFSRDLWGMKIEGVAIKGSENFTILFTYTFKLSQLKEDLKDLIDKTDTFYLRCMGGEIVRYPDRIVAKIDGDDMEEGQEYKIVFEAPTTFKCMWRG